MTSFGARAHIQQNSGAKSAVSANMAPPLETTGTYCVNLPKAKPGTSKRPRMLTQSERESLRREMRQSSAWMGAELKRQRDARKTQEG